MQTAEDLRLGPFHGLIGQQVRKEASRLAWQRVPKQQAVQPRTPGMFPYCWQSQGGTAVMVNPPADPGLTQPAGHQRQIARIEAKAALHRGQLQQRHELVHGIAAPGEIEQGKKAVDQWTLCTWAAIGDAEGKRAVVCARRKDRLDERRIGLDIRES